MVVEFGVFTSLVTLAARQEVLKAMHVELDNETKNKIMTEGIYHFTTKACAESIVKTGFYIPSKGLLNNHFAKGKSGRFASFVYMFGGKPNPYLFGKNLNDSMAEKDGTFYAVRHYPDKYDLNNYMQRIEDGAIMYEGRLDVKHNKPEIARFKMEKGKIVEIPLDEKVELPNVAEKTKKAIKSFVKAFEIVGSEVKDIVLFKDKEHKVKKCKIKRKLEEKILKQYNEEKNVKMYDITKDDKNYTVYLCDDVVIDGKRLAEAFVCGNKFGEEPLKKVYVEAGKEKILKEKSMAKFFEKGIDFSSSKDEYIGEPQISSEGITIKKDEEFSKHFIGKQMATEIADKNHIEYITSKNKGKIGIDFFKKIYEKVSERNRSYARNIIKRFKEKDTSKERNTQTKEMEER